MPKSNLTVRWITRSAILLAILIVIQFLLRLIPDPVTRQLITGSMVNFILLYSFVQVDVFSGVIISLISPVLAYSLGIQAFPAMIPFIMLGNAVYVASFALIRGKKPNWIRAILGLFVGVGLKFGLLSLSAKYLVNAPAKIAQAMSFPQLLTALIGGIFIILLEIKPIPTKR